MPKKDSDKKSGKTVSDKKSGEKDSNKKKKNVEILPPEPEEIIKINAKELWHEMVGEIEEKSRAVEEYKKTKYKPDNAPLHTSVAYLNEEIFDVLISGLKNMLHKVKKYDSLNHQRRFFNGVDFLAEYVWNMNPQHRERQQNKTHIFQMKWVQKYLKENPRPYYPKHLIWIPDFAAIKIQACFRGYVDRKKYQKLLQASKTPKKDKNDKKSSKDKKSDKKKK